MSAPAARRSRLRSEVGGYGRPEDPDRRARIRLGTAVRGERHDRCSLAAGLISLLHDIPALALFLSVALGTIIGRVHVKGVGLGSVVGTLIAGMIIGITAHPE